MSWDKHPAVRTGNDLPIGDRAADGAVRGMGSWAFLGAQTVFMAVWMSLNVVGYTHHWDVYPFILLNLMLSTQAAYAAPLILLATRRQDTRNAEVAQSDLETDRATYELLARISEHLGVPAGGVPSEDPKGELQEDPQGVPWGEPETGHVVIENTRFGDPELARQYFREMYEWNARDNHSTDCPRHCICWGPLIEGDCE